MSVTLPFYHAKRKDHKNLNIIKTLLIKFQLNVPCLDVFFFFFYTVSVFFVHLELLLLHLCVYMSVSVSLAVFVSALFACLVWAV